MPTRNSHALDTIFSPRSIAVVGTNNAAGTVPHDIFANLLTSGFKGVLYPVSPGAKQVKSVKSYKYVVDIPDPVDLAVIVFPSHVCHMALEQCGEKGIRSAVIISAGFREVGGKGRALEENLKDIARRHGISFVGPNCLGVINTDPDVQLNASFARRMPIPGPIGFLSQSGALCTAVLDYAWSKRIGFSKFASFGNKADVSEIDMLYHLAEDEHTKVILLYLEEITAGRELMEAARTILSETGKPILLLKSGRTEAGAAAAASHTGSLAGGDDVCNAALGQCGIVRCDDIEDMFNTAVAMAYQPRPAGRRAAIITNAGGPGVLAADAAVRWDLQLARFDEPTTESLRKSLPATANIKNPVDVIGDARADRYRAAIDPILKDSNVDAAFVILTPQSMTDIESIAEAIAHCSNGGGKPVYASFMGEADVRAGIEILQRARVPNYTMPESICRAFSRVVKFHESLDRIIDPPAGIADIDADRARGILGAGAPEGGLLPAGPAMELLNLYGIPAAGAAVSASPEETGEIAGKLGCPVALKIDAPGIVHKTESGGVALNLATPAEAAAAHEAMLHAVQANHPGVKIRGALVQKMAPAGGDVIVGMKRDPAFGPVVLFGMGGIFVELFEDVSIRVAPPGPKAIDSMIRETRAYPLLRGARGQKPLDTAAAADALARLSRLALDCPAVQEIDINPLRLFEEGKGCQALDVKILIQTPEVVAPCAS